MEDLVVRPELWRGRRVLLTGHTGFKGAWAARRLARAGAEVFGLALPPEPGPSLFQMLGAEHLAASCLIDLRDVERVRAATAEARPEIVLHLAAQALVRRSYADPAAAFASNVMGTAHLLDALRAAPDLRAVVVVTSDKVYENDESGRAFAEHDRLGGRDPYSASKAATEIVVASFARSFFDVRRTPVVTARAGNVIGGGDFAEDRLVPDIVRTVAAGGTLELRNPQATRPWLHVLDCLEGYLRFAEALLEDGSPPQALNFGPDVKARPVTVAELAATIQAAIGAPTGWAPPAEAQPHEMSKLSVDPSLAQAQLGWRPRLDTDGAIAWTAEWYGGWLADAAAARALTDAQIATFDASPP